MSKGKVLTVVFKEALSSDVTGEKCLCLILCRGCVVEICLNFTFVHTMRRAP